MTNLRVSVSLRSIIHSYGLIRSELLKVNPEFPSPYGVSFILIEYIYKIKSLKDRVSVSLRSIIHSYYRGSMEE